MKKQLIGVLLNNSVWKNAKNGSSYEQLSMYLEAAEKHDVQVCFFCLSDVNLRTRSVLVNIKQKRKWKLLRIPFPKVIHNRAIFTKDQDNAKLLRFRRTGVTIYNAFNYYSKLKIYNILKKNTAIKRYLPVTYPFSKKNLRLLLDAPSFFVKPDKGSLGKGIIKVTKMTPIIWKVTHQIKKHLKTVKVQEKDLYHFISNYIGKRRYFLQKTINLQRYNQAPFDIRVAIQKDRKGKWQITGLVGKVALIGAYLSNVHQGGYIVRFEELFMNNEVEYVRNVVSKAALLIIHHLDKYLPHLADVGIDFGVDMNGTPNFIEMNSRDQRYSFELAELGNIFRKTYENPIAYGKYLLELDTLRQLSYP